jgi:hypothetical protein
LALARYLDEAGLDAGRNFAGKLSSVTHGRAENTPGAPRQTKRGIGFLAGPSNRLKQNTEKYLIPTTS